jgi:hypothetical protein
MTLIALYVDVMDDVEDDDEEEDRAFAPDPEKNEDAAETRTARIRPGPL